MLPNAAGEDRELLDREINTIMELLQEQPDSKCKNSHLHSPTLKLTATMQGAWSPYCITNACFSKTISKEVIQKFQQSVKRYWNNLKKSIHSDGRDITI